MANNDTTYTDATQNPASVYFLHPSDQASSKLVSIVFNGTNYGKWKRSMVIALTSKNKMGFVDGSLPKPSSTSKEYKAWERCNTMIIGWFLASLDDFVSQSVLYHKLASDIWKELEERDSSKQGVKLGKVGAKKTFFCEHCKATGDTITRCYKLHGYPNQNTEKKVAAVTYNNEDVLQQSGLTHDQFSRLMSFIDKQQQGNVNDSEEHHAELAASTSMAGILGPRPVQGYCTDSSSTIGYCPTDIDQAMHTLLLTSPDEQYYMDTGATSHITKSQGIGHRENNSEV